MKKTSIVGIVGVLLLVAAMALSLADAMLSPIVALILLLMTLGAAVLGTVAGVWENKWWFLEAAVAVLAALFVLFGLVGP